VSVVAIPVTVIEVDLAQQLAGRDGARALDGDHPTPIAPLAGTSADAVDLADFARLIRQDNAYWDGGEDFSDPGPERFEGIFSGRDCGREHFCNLGHIESPFQRRIEALCTFLEYDVSAHETIGKIPYFQ
jgi:hypothetical protein